MNENELKARTKQFGLRVMDLVNSLPKTTAGRAIGNQLIRSGTSVGGHEMLGLYAEGITKMPENPGIPLLFLDIFKNAYLPYRDPETLKAFLKNH